MAKWGSPNLYFCFPVSVKQLLAARDPPKKVTCEVDDGFAGSGYEHPGLVSNIASKERDVCRSSVTKHSPISLLEALTPSTSIPPQFTISH